MGKAKEQRIEHTRLLRPDHGQVDDVAVPICECCSLYGEEEYGPIHSRQNKISRDGEDLKEIVVIGAGPHSMSLILRLLQPDADFLSEKERHYKMEHHSKKLRPIPAVRRYVRDLMRGTASVLKKKGSKIKYSKANPPPIDLMTLRKSTLVIDRSTPASENDSGWLSHWNQNFDAIKIPYLRSPITAHMDPFDHRSLDVYADIAGRQEELISLKLLTQRDKDFHGPYQAPSTSLFKDFHLILAKAYGIDELVQSSAEVESIIPRSGAERSDQEPYFEVFVRRVTKLGGEVKRGEVLVVRAKRLVCAMGPMFQKGSEFWEQSLPPICRHRLLHCHEIVPWLLSNREHHSIPGNTKVDVPNLLIVGGGITGTHLALMAARALWCKSVTMIQRSRTKERQFDIDNKWMGPMRGRLLDSFLSKNSASKVQFLKEARKGGSVPPELARKLLQTAQESQGRVQVKQEVQISEVAWTGDQFRVQLDDGSPEECFDMIWMATGADNDIDLYKPLQQLVKDLPVDVVGGLPVLDSDLTWQRASSSSDEEAPWKGVLRRRLHVMGCLAGLQLGPDALNVIGARHGAVRVAKALRLDMCDKEQLKNQ